MKYISENKVDMETAMETWYMSAYCPICENYVKFMHIEDNFNEITKDFAGSNISYNDKQRKFIQPIISKLGGANYFIKKEFQTKCRKEFWKFY